MVGPQAGNIALLRLSINDSNGPLRSNLLKDQQLNGYVWMSMVAKLPRLQSTRHSIKTNGHSSVLTSLSLFWFSLTADIQTGNTISSVQMENAWLTGQLRATLYFCTILRMPLASSLIFGTLVVTLI